MHQIKAACGEKPSHMTGPEGNKWFRLMTASLLLAVTGTATCGGEQMPEYLKETHRSKTYPSCTYAVYRDPAGCEESSVLYYFHGSGGDENTWYQSNREIITTWEKSGVRPPVVVAVTFGRDWLMFPEETSERSIHLGKFVHECMPEIERIIGGKITRRLLYGFSIGGANAAQLLFRYPELFEKAAIVSPQVYTFSIYSSDSEIEAIAQTVPVTRGGPIGRAEGWIKKNILRRNSVAIGIGKELSQIKWNVPDPRLWEQADILKNVKPAPAGRRISVYLSCGRQDEIGLFPGTEALARIASGNGYDVTFDLLEGGHMARDQQKIARFLGK